MADAQERCCASTSAVALRLFMLIESCGVEQQTALPIQHEVAHALGKRPDDGKRGRHRLQHHLPECF
jgi:hypothetical protein